MTTPPDPRRSTTTVSFVDDGDGSYDPERRHVDLPRSLRFASEPESDDQVANDVTAPA